LNSRKTLVVVPEPHRTTLNSRRASFVEPEPQSSSKQNQRKKPEFLFKLPAMNGDSDSNAQTSGNKPSRMVDKMLAPSARDAPRFSSKKPHELRRFLRLMEDLWKGAGVNDDQVKKTSIGKYADQESEEEWAALESYGDGHSWDEFKDELLENYPEAAAAERGTPARIRQLCSETREVRLGDLHALYSFRRAFMAEAKKLSKPPAAMANRELVELFISCLSERLASAVLQYLGNKTPSVAKGTANAADGGNAVPRRPEDRYDLEEVCKAAIQVSESSQGMFNLLKKESSESVEGRGVYLFNQPTSDTKALVQKVEELEGAQALEKDRLVTVNKNIDSKFTELENMFKTFMTQNQTVAKSSGCKDDCKGNGCKTHEASTSSTPAQRWGRSMDKEKCYYCGGMGHFQADCEELKTHVRQGSVKVNPEGKLRLKDGSFIPNQPAGATIKERVDRHYARRPSQYFYGEYEDDDPVTTAAPKYASQYLNSSDDAERRLARREAELELKQREDALELRRRKLELEEKKLEQSSEPSRMANLLDVLGQLTEDDLAAIKVARSGFP